MKILKAKYHLCAAMRIVLYKALFGNRFICGNGVTFRRNFNVYLERDARIEIGEKCFFNHGCSLNALLEIKIGGGCIFGENVKIYDHNHRFADRIHQIKEQGYSVAPVEIGAHCWIGSNVTVLKGTKIGDNCVIGAGCVIAEEIPENSIVTMNRELVIKPIHDYGKEKINGTNSDFT